MFRSLKKWILALPLLLIATPAFAAKAAPAAINSGDTAWMLMATALVLLMVPGLAFFYAGMVKGKNVVSTLFQNLIALGVVGVVWIIIGFSLAFSGSGAFIGDTAKVMLEGVGMTPDKGHTVPANLLMAFQMMFAIITPALMTGAFAERVRFLGWIVVLVLWSLLVYAPVAHWVWAPTGWLAERGVQDFAGGTVVHMTAGFSAFIAALVFGRRNDFKGASKPYDTGYVVLGTALLWFGWFGFNAGSAGAADGLAAQAFVNTFAAAATALVVWTLTDTLKDGKPSAIGGCMGVVAGLAAITPAAGYVTVASALIIGALAAFLCNVVARFVKDILKVDDTLDVFACHGFGGMLGVFLTGILGNSAVSGAAGLMEGGDKLFYANLLAIPAVALYSMAATFVILKLAGVVIRLRVTTQEENQGLDANQHGEKINCG